MADHAKTLEASTASTAASVTEVAASVSEVAANAEKNATVIDSNVMTIEQLARSAAATAQSVEAVNARRRRRVRRGAVGRLHPAHRPARDNAHDRGAISAAARDSGATAQKSIKGFGSATRSRVRLGDEGDGEARRGDRRHRPDHQPHRGPHEPALAERQHRGRAPASTAGFAVVAEEIRALADRAAASSADVAKIVRGPQASVRGRGGLVDGWPARGG